MAQPASVGQNYSEPCSETIPSIDVYYKALSGKPVYLVVLLLSLFSLVTIATVCIYIAEIRTIYLRLKKNKKRAEKTVWLLGLFPVFSVTALIGLFIPRSGTLGILVSHGYLGCCLFKFLGLLLDYIGGYSELWLAVTGYPVPLSSIPPLGCCRCLPSITFSKKTCVRLVAMVFQTSVVRPVVAFIGAVILMDGVYSHSYAYSRHPLSDPFLYLNILDVLSTLPAMCALNILKAGLARFLGKHAIGAKLACIQMVLFWSITPNLLFKNLIHSGVIGCSEWMPGIARGIYYFNASTIIVMFFISLFARRTFKKDCRGQTPHIDQSFLSTDNTYSNNSVIRHDNSYELLNKAAYHQQYITDEESHLDQGQSSSSCGGSYFSPSTTTTVTNNLGIAVSQNTIMRFETGV